MSNNKRDKLSSKSTTKEKPEHNHAAITEYNPDGQKPRTRGRGGTGNFASVIEAKGEDISRCMNHCLMFYNMPIVKTPEECRQRLYDFFSVCAETGQLPTVEKMAMALGTVRQVVWKWEHGDGCPPATSDLIKKAKEFIAAFESEMVTEGKINPVVYIFRAKNYFGLKDQQEIVIAPENPLGDYDDPAKLEARIMELPAED